MAMLLPEDATLAEVREFFKNDRFATVSLAPEILEASRGHAKLRMQAGPDHANAMGNLMGGVLFTLADYAFAIASCVGQPPTVAVSNTIDYLRGSTPCELVAVCDLVKDGARMCFAEARVYDASGRELARMSIKGCRVG